MRKTIVILVGLILVGSVSFILYNKYKDPYFVLGTATQSALSNSEDSQTNLFALNRRINLKEISLAPYPEVEEKYSLEFKASNLAKIWCGDGTEKPTISLQNPSSLTNQGDTYISNASASTCYGGVQQMTVTYELGTSSNCNSMYLSNVENQILEGSGNGFLVDRLEFDSITSQYAYTENFNKDGDIEYYLKCISPNSIGLGYMFIPKVTPVN